MSDFPSIEKRVMQVLRGIVEDSMAAGAIRIQQKSIWRLRVRRAEGKTNRGSALACLEEVVAHLGIYFQASAACCAVLHARYHCMRWLSKDVVSILSCGATQENALAQLEINMQSMTVRVTLWTVSSQAVRALTSHTSSRQHRESS